MKSGSRLLNETNEINIRKLIEINLIRGDNSTQIEDFEYTVEVIEFTQLYMKLQLNFTNPDPLTLSTGKELDRIRFNLTHPELFTSAETLLSIENGTVLEVKIPRQVPDEKEYEVLQ